MNNTDLADLRHRWFPICAEQDLAANHVFESVLLGQELAVWRGASGSFNVWENRCPHRGLRLTLGANLGGELRCAYHGYRFAENTGVCTSVPAQPGKMPPRSLCVHAFPALERGGLIWTRLAADGPEAGPPPAMAAAPMTLYSVAINASIEVVGGLVAEYRFRPSAALGRAPAPGEVCATSAIDAFRFRSVATQGRVTSDALLFTQPVDAQCTVVHGILFDTVAAEHYRPTLEHHAANFTVLRAAAERCAAVGAPTP